MRFKWNQIGFGAFLFFTQVMKVSAADTEVITVGSKSFTENRILAEMMAQLIEERMPIQVKRKINLGGTALVFSALQSGEIDLYPEYTGTGWYIHLKLPKEKLTPLKTYLTVKREFLDRFQLKWLEPFGLNNSYALAVRTPRAKEWGVSQVSDLKAIKDQIRVGVTHEFLNREDGYPELVAAYGLRFKSVRGLEHGLAYEAIANGKVDVIDTWTTDGKLKRYELTVLEDNLQHFPPYYAAPVVRVDALLNYPKLESLLNELAFRIDNQRMQAINYSVEEGGKSHAQAARDFLLAEGLFDRSDVDRQENARPTGFFALLWSPSTGARILEHLWLTMLSLLAAMIVSVPLGIVLTHHDRLAQLGLGFAGVLQTIPSLALLALMIPWLGLGAVPAMMALFLYALLPILRNTYAGIRAVDPEVLESAYAMGLKSHQVLLRIQLPLATQTIMAGIRTATVIGIGVATLAAFIGAGGLGEPIVTGLQLNNKMLILSGALPAALLALLADFFLGRFERWVTPQGLKVADAVAQAAM